MERVNINGVDGVFIPNNEFEEIKNKIAEQKKLINELLKEIAPKSTFDELMALKYSYEK